MSGGPYRTTCTICQRSFSMMAEDRLLRVLAAHLTEAHQIRIVAAGDPPWTDAERAHVERLLGPLPVPS